MHFYVFSEGQCTEWGIFFGVAKRGSSTLYGIYIGFCPRIEFYKILQKDCLLHVCSICEIFTHSSISVVKFK